jgi:hypothetical protein
VRNLLGTTSLGSASEIQFLDFFFFFAVGGMEPRALCTCSTTELPPQLPNLGLLLEPQKVIVSSGGKAGKSYYGHHS